MPPMKAAALSELEYLNNYTSERENNSFQKSHGKGKLLESYGALLQRGEPSSPGLVRDSQRTGRDL